MLFNSYSHISSVDDVKLFFHHLVCDRKINFHPDDDFDSYVRTKDLSSPFFNQNEVTIYNRLMKEAFVTCTHAEVDIYSLGLEEMRTHLSITA